MGLTRGFRIPFSLLLYVLVFYNKRVSLGLFWFQVSELSGIQSPNQGPFQRGLQMSKNHQHFPGPPEACSHLWLPGQLHSSHLPLAARPGETTLQAGSLPYPELLASLSPLRRPRRGGEAPLPPPLLTRLAVGQAQHSAQRGEDAPRLAQLLADHGERLHLAASRHE